MFSILIKYKSTTNKTFWYDYEVEQEDGTTSLFSTTDKDVLLKEIKKLDSEIGFSNIKVIDDLTFDITAEFTEIVVNTEQVATPDDINNIYETAFDEVFGDGGI